MSRLAVLIVTLSLGACGVRRDLHRGEEALSRGRSNAAVQAYRGALAKRPKNRAAQLGYAEALLANGQAEEALKPARAAFEGGSAAAAPLLAEALLSTGQPREAERVLSQSDLEKSEDLLRLSAETRLALGDAAGATALLGPKVDTATAPRLILLAAWLAQRAGDSERALALASRAASLAPEGAEIQAEAATVLALVGARDLAHEAASTARGLSSLDPSRWIREAAMRDQGGDREGALRLLSRAAVFSPEDGKLAFQCGQLALALDQVDRATGWLELALTLKPYRAPKATTGVMVAEAGGLPEEERRVKAAEVLRVLSTALASRGDLRGSASARQAALEATGGSEADWIAAVELWRAAEDKGAAMTAVNAALRAHSSSAPLRLLLARVLADLGQRDLALGQARLAWEADPALAEAALFLGGLYEERGERRAALQIYQVTAGAHPEDKALVEALQRVSR